MNTKIIKKRIRTAKSISQITKAMEMVAASKMRKSQSKALAARPYSQNLKKVLMTLLSSASQINHALMKENGQENALILLISTNKGLCGGLNTNHFRNIRDFVAQKKIADLQFAIIGKKARNYLLKSPYKLLADFSEIDEDIRFEQTVPISHFLIDLFCKATVGKVYVSYQDFVSTLSQKPKIVQILPVKVDLLSAELGVVAEPMSKDYLIEPNAKQIADWLLPYFVELIIYHYLLEAKAAEHSARMVAMKNASENAHDIVEELSLSYNKARQAQITAQIAEVASARLALQ
jgi:F-type H+-transporting ATPase subunit gamma